MNDLYIEDLKNINILEPYEVKWYKQKNKLGKFMHANLYPGTDQAKKCLVRYIDMDRISSYVIEKFQTRLIQLYQI